MPTRYFRFPANPNAPLLKFDSKWEADIQAKHPEYVEVLEADVPEHLRGMSPAPVVAKPQEVVKTKPYRAMLSVQRKAG